MRTLLQFFRTLPLHRTGMRNEQRAWETSVLIAKKYSMKLTNSWLQRGTSWSKYGNNAARYTLNRECSTSVTRLMTYESSSLSSSNCSSTSYNEYEQINETSWRELPLIKSVLVFRAVGCDKLRPNFIRFGLLGKKLRIFNTLSCTSCFHSGSGAWGWNIKY